MVMSWRGIFPIVVTPFTQSYALDETGLRKLVGFCVEGGATGLVGPANASEFAMLSDDERKRWIEIVVHEAGGQIPVIATTTCGHAIPAAALSRFAQDVGADGVMLMPPHVVHADADGCYDYYQTISDAIDIPVMIQNYIGPIGTPMSSELVARMCREIEHVEYIKEETHPASRKVIETIQAAGGDCKGVFGGQGGVYMIDDYRRGSVGNMPACQSIDVHVAIWNRLEAGDEAGARTLFNRLLPLINYERQYGVALYKEVLVRRGIIDSTACRLPNATLGDFDKIELDAILSDIEPLFTI
jgi:4-hydroxy-tetrahydrodipicolinate synthase